MGGGFPMWWCTYLEHVIRPPDTPNLKAAREAASHHAHEIVSMSGLENPSAALDSELESSVKLRDSLSLQSLARRAALKRSFLSASCGIPRPSALPARSPRSCYVQHWRQPVMVLCAGLRGSHLHTSTFGLRRIQRLQCPPK